MIGRITELFSLRRKIVESPEVHAEARPEGATQRLHLDYLDGMRAMAALTVAVFHAFQMFGLGLSDFGQRSVTGGLGDGLIDRVIYYAYHGLFQWGDYAVEVFIVISGFSLMLQVARSMEGRLPKGARGYYMRRIRRILPPYYAALILSLLLIALVPGMGTANGVYWDFALPAFTPGVLSSHFLFFHNGSSDWFYSINPPMWSIAVEEQIYLLFPLLVLMWRAWGKWVTLAIALAVGVVQVYLPFSYPLSHSWYLGLFTLGMLGALIGFSPRPQDRQLREALPWGWLSVAAAAMFFMVSALDHRLGLDYKTATWIGDTLVGVAVLCLMVSFGKVTLTPGARVPLMMRLLRLPPLVAVGKFAYSLYLLHVPVLALVTLACLRSGLPLTWSYLVVIFIGVPLAVLAAYLFYLPFERPFMTTQPRRTKLVAAKQLEKSAVEQMSGQPSL